VETLDAARFLVFDHALCAQGATGTTLTRRIADAWPKWYEASVQQQQTVPMDLVATGRSAKPGCCGDQLNARAEEPFSITRQRGLGEGRPKPIASPAD